jgi:hypothetical protein
MSPDRTPLGKKRKLASHRGSGSRLQSTDTPSGASSSRISNGPKYFLMSSQGTRSSGFTDRPILSRGRPLRANFISDGRAIISYAALCSVWSGGRRCPVGKHPVGSSTSKSSSLPVVAGSTRRNRPCLLITASGATSVFLSGNTGVPRKSSSKAPRRPYSCANRIKALLNCSDSFKISRIGFALLRCLCHASVCLRDS